MVDVSLQALKKGYEVMILNPNGIYWYDNRARVRKRNVIGGNVTGLLIIYHEQEAPPLTHMNFSMVPGKESFHSTMISTCMLTRTHRKWRTRGTLSLCFPALYQVWRINSRNKPCSIPFFLFSKCKAERIAIFTLGWGGHTLTELLNHDGKFAAFGKGRIHWQI